MNVVGGHKHSGMIGTMLIDLAVPPLEISLTEKIEPETIYWEVSGPLTCIDHSFIFLIL